MMFAWEAKVGQDHSQACGRLAEEKWTEPEHRGGGCGLENHLRGWGLLFKVIWVEVI